ncbi:unnamed protein product [Mytilus coruscus]|uniref:Peptidase A2 domain-containing protein n=1 Tax=Mytilus coruscus TaxID=42192 RepID=A0A6J8AJQ6_MYTCO|nr:unnamed protein product [Mytilus coruscus]
MVRRKTQTPATDTEYSDEFEEYITEQCDTEYDVTSGQSDYEHKDETVIFRPKPSTSTAVKPSKPVQQTQRKSLRLLQKKQINKASETDMPSQQMNQGDSIEMGGLNKNVFVDMTTQIVSATLRNKIRNPRYRLISIATSHIFKSRSRPKSGQNVKLPAFTGNEKWEVWLNRFQAVARLINWDDNEKLRELIPRLQGEAGDFVFDQLPSKILDKYTKLIKELRNRFGNPKVVTDEVKFKGGNDSSDVTDDRSLVKKKCSQEEEKSLDVTNEKSLVPEIDEEIEVSSKVKDETPQSDKLDIIGRQVVRCDGVYIEGNIQGVKVTFTADTGAARTVISTHIFKKIPQSDRPKLEKSNTLASANGQPLVEKGKAVFNLELGNVSLAKELVVAEIEDEVLLGLDILMKGEMGPADIKLTEGVILLNGVTIPCIQIGQPEPVRKVRAADNFTIPPQSEILIDVFVDKTENDPISSPKII